MSGELKDFILKCEICYLFKQEQPREQLMPHEIPSRPWQKVGTNLFYFDRRPYLITVVCYSSFFEVDKLHRTYFRTVIEKLKMQFSCMEFRRLSFLAMVHIMLLQSSQSLQVTGTFNTLSPLRVILQVTEKLRVL